MFWLVFLTALVGLAIVDPPIAAGVARTSIGALAVVGLILIFHLAIHGFRPRDHADPDLALLVAWVAAAGLTIMGRLDSDLVQPALIGGLVLIVMLIGFTVMQHAFTGGPLAAAGMSGRAERRALALAVRATSSSTGTSPETTSSSHRISSMRSGTSAAGLAAQPRTGSTTSTPSTATASGPRSTR
jgi:hypothetical protein